MSRFGQAGLINLKTKHVPSDQFWSTKIGLAGPLLTSKIGSVTQHFIGNLSAVIAQ